MYKSNIRALKYRKQILPDLKRKIHISAIIIGVFNALISIMNRRSKQKINKEIEDLTLYKLITSNMYISNI